MNANIKKISAALIWISFFSASLSLSIAVAGRFFPGLLSYDSVYQIQQAFGIMPKSDMFPALMTELISLNKSHLLLGLHYFYVQLIVISVFHASAILILLMGPLRKFSQARQTICVVLGLLVPAVPPFAVIDATIWKDPIFTWASFLFYCSCLLLVGSAEDSASKEKARISPLTGIVCGGLCAGISVSLRKNGIYIVAPTAIATVALVYIMLPPPSRLRTTFLGMVAFLVFTMIPTSMNAALTYRNSMEIGYQHDWQNVSIATWTIKNDGMQLVKGWPNSISAEEYRDLSSSTDVERIMGSTRLYNSYYQITFHEIKKTSSEKLFVESLLNVLKNHPGLWLLTKSRYVWQLVYSRDGYQTAGAKDFNCETPVTAVLCERWDETDRNSAEQENLISYLHPDATHLWNSYAWTYVSEFFGASILLIFLGLEIFKKGWRQCRSIAVDNWRLCLALLMCISVGGPFALGSSTNDFRYFLLIKLIFLSAIAQIGLRKVTENIALAGLGDGANSSPVPLPING